MMIGSPRHELVTQTWYLKRLFFAYKKDDLTSRHCK
jgi:hypothetical protein